MLYSSSQCTLVHASYVMDYNLNSKCWKKVDEQDRPAVVSSVAALFREESFYIVINHILNGLLDYYAITISAFSLR